MTERLHLTYSTLCCFFKSTEKPFLVTLPEYIIMLHCIVEIFGKHNY